MYETIKALHLIAIICWFAGLFYLPRLFVYHAMAEQKGNQMLQTMERKLYKYIMHPSMVLTWVFGLWMLYLIPEWGQSGWLHAKLTLVFILTGYHHICGKYVKVFAQNQNQKTHKFYRYFNEVPTVLLILIVFLAVLKPF